MNIRWLFGGIAFATCAVVLVSPDQRNPENFRKLFAEQGLQLESLQPASGCYRSFGYSYSAHNGQGRPVDGHICVSKFMSLFSFTRSDEEAS